MQSLRKSRSLSLCRSRLFVDPSIKQLRGVTIFQAVQAVIIRENLYHHRNLFASHARRINARYTRVLSQSQSDV